MSTLANWYIFGIFFWIMYVSLLTWTKHRREAQYFPAVERNLDYIQITSI